MRPGWVFNLQFNLNATIKLVSDILINIKRKYINKLLSKIISFSLAYISVPLRVVFV